MLRFEKVPFEEFKKSMFELFGKDFSEDVLQKIYDNIKLPKRSTKGSAGYDFYAPFNIHMPGEQLKTSVISPNDIKLLKDYITIPTGIRFVTDRDDIVLLCAPRSGLGFKYGLRLKNTLGVIDSDYQHAENHGHILAKLGSETGVDIEMGKAFMQGIFVNFIKVDDEIPELIQDRTGGFGSTDGKS